jgi:hypothetical protein
LVPSCTGSPEQWLARRKEEEKYGKQKERSKNVKIKIYRQIGVCENASSLRWNNGRYVGGGGGEV